MTRNGGIGTPRVSHRKGSVLRRLAVVGFIAALAVALLAVIGGAGAGTSRVADGSATAPTVDFGSAIVQLEGDPLATSVRTKPTRGKKIDFSGSTVRSYRAQLSALRNDFKEWLRANAPAAKVTREFDISLNAVALNLNGTKLATIRSAPMVKAADHQGIYRPAGHDEPDLRLVHDFQSWAAWGSTPEAKGEGIKVPIVDSGIDVIIPASAMPAIRISRGRGSSR